MSVSIISEALEWCDGSCDCDELDDYAEQYNLV